MKKIILTLMVTLSIVSCKKYETSEAKSETTETDSAASVNTDSTIAFAKKEVTSKILDLEEEKKMLDEKFKTELDSSTKESIVNEIKNTERKIDSVRKTVVSVVNNIQIPQKTVKETKIVFKESPKAKKIQEPVKIVTKTGNIDILVDDMETGKEIAKDQIRKYDGIIKSEQISQGNEWKTNYLKISVPYQKSDYLLEDLERNVGKIEQKNIQILGEQYSENAICDLEITLLQKNNDIAALSAVPQTFGGRMTNAFGSGWNVIQEIFLFLLPFWPVFLIGGGIFYYLKKKNKPQETEQKNI